MLPLRTRDRVPTTSWRRVPSGGFSLVEILVALTIVGVAVAMSIPRVSRAVTQTNIQRAAQALQSEVQQAFAIAGRNRAPVTIRWDAATTQLRVTDLTGNIVYRRLGVGAGGGYGLSASEVMVTPSPLTVFPTGLAADTLVIALSRSGYSRRIWVSRSGIVKVQ